MAKASFDIEFNADDVAVVKFEADPHWEDDSFDYEYGSISATEKIQPYLSLEGEDITWHKSEYSEEENKIIAEWLMANYVTVENAILKAATEEDRPGYKIKRQRNSQLIAGK